MHIFVTAFGLTYLARHQDRLDQVSLRSMIYSPRPISLLQLSFAQDPTTDTLIYLFDALQKLTIAIVKAFSDNQSMAEI